MCFFNKKLIGPCLAAAASLCIASHVHAADFFSRYLGTVGASSIAGITAGQPYAITLVLNNDDDNANSQTWNEYHVQCVLVSALLGLAAIRSRANTPCSSTA